MKKLLLLSSMLFLGSCGNSDKTFTITSLGLTGKAAAAKTLTLNFDSMNKVAHGALSFAGTLTMGTATKCKFTATKVLLAETSSVTSLDFVIAVDAITGVAADDNPACKAAGDVKDINIPGKAFSITVDGKTTTNLNYTHATAITIEEIGRASCRERV